MYTFYCKPYNSWSINHNDNMYYIKVVEILWRELNFDRFLFVEWKTDSIVVVLLLGVGRYNTRGIRPNHHRGLSSRVHFKFSFFSWFIKFFPSFILIRIYLVLLFFTFSFFEVVYLSLSIMPAFSFFFNNIVSHNNALYIINSLLQYYLFTL